MLTGTMEGDTMDGWDPRAEPMAQQHRLAEYEHVQLVGMRAELLTTVDDMVRDLTRAVDPGGYRLLCPITGCGWELDVPAAETVHDLDRAAGRYVLRVVGAGREQVERAVGAHMDWHAEQTETDVLDEQDPDAAAGVDPRTGVPLEQSGVNVRLAP